MEIQQIKKIAKYANKLIYGEEYDLNEESGRQKFIETFKISNKLIGLVKAYTIINYTTEKQLPLNKMSAINLHKELKLIENELRSNPLELKKIEKDINTINREIKLNNQGAKIYEINKLMLVNDWQIKKNLLAVEAHKLKSTNIYLEREKVKLMANLLITSAYLNAGLGAFNDDPDSYRGRLYKCEKKIGGPITLEKRKTISKNSKR